MRSNQLISWVMVTLSSLVFQSCCTTKVIKTAEGEFGCPCCEPIVKYSGNKFSINGIVFSGSVSPEVIQKAYALTQILDIHRVSTCQLLPAFVSAGTNQYNQAVAKMLADTDRLTELAMIISSHNDAAIEKWVADHTHFTIGLLRDSELPNKKRITLIASTQGAFRKNYGALLELRLAEMIALSEKKGSKLMALKPDKYIIMSATNEFGNQY